MKQLKRETEVRRSANVMDGRAGFQLAASWGSVSVLESGGHICTLSLNQCPGINPLWRPPWKTIDPQKYAPGKHSRRYGRPPDGKLLAGIAGHSLSFDYFGPPSIEETAAGLSTHGEAPSLKWQRQKQTDARSSSLRYGVRLPQAQIQFSRSISVDRQHPVIYCEEEAVNLSRCDRPISWNEHVTFGPPFLECGTTLLDMPATHAKVCPSSFSSRMALRPDAEFTWPMAPTQDGKNVDLRATPEERFGHYTAQLLDPKLRIAFIAVCNPRLRLLVVYAFRRADFPWVGNWEERNNRSQAPWKARTFCRGVEFSTTPFAIPRRDTLEQGKLFGEPTYRWLSALSACKVRWVIMLFHVPEDFHGVSKLSLAEGQARIVEPAPGGRELNVQVRNFL